jgi:hypothetical protein
MATPIDLLDPPAVMSYGGLVDASTVEGHVDEHTDWGGAIAALLSVDKDESSAAVCADREARPARHLAHITRRRGAYTGRR